MRKYTSLILIFIAILGLLTLSSCKRAAVDDPKVVGPAGYRISVVGKADPAILHVPQGLPAAYATVTVKVLDNTAKPVVNKSIIFTEGLYGYFADSPTSQAYKVSDTRLTDSNGIAQIYYIVAPNTPINATKQTLIVCTLQDDGRNDNSIGTPFDQIPVTIIPYAETGYYLSGRVLLENQTPLEGITITLTDSADKNTSMAVTKTDGSYGFLVKSGWFGKITPSNGSYQFMPTQYTFYYSVPVTANQPNLDFIVSSQSQLSANATHLNAKGSGGFSIINLSNSLSTAPIDFTVSTSDAWLSFDKLGGVTPTSLKITSAMNPTTNPRTGKVIVTANASSVKNSPLEITVSQEAGPSLIVDPNPVYIAATFLGTTNALIKNATSSDTLHWSASSSTTWLTYSPAGSTTGSTIAIQAQTENHTGFTREGYILIQAYDTNDNILEGITATIRVIQASTSPRQK